MKTSATVLAASALATGVVPQVYAGGKENSTLQVALVGCGGRGTGAAANALSTTSGSMRLVAMADVFQHRLDASHESISSKFDQQVDVPEDRRFVSFDGYKQAMDCLNPGDIVILATPPAFRWVQFTYAIEKGLNVFMEKPVAVDGPSAMKMFRLGEEAKKKNLKVGVGLMCRHCDARGELFDRVQNGEIGDLILMRAYRMAGPTAHEAAAPKPDGISELLYQIQEFHSFLWASGGCYSDFLIHNIDECCWIKNAWPVEAQATGGRHYRGNSIDQNFDHYSVEYTFDDGSKLYLDGRTIAGCHNEFASFAHGSKGSAVISTAGHVPSRARIYKGQRQSKSDLVWAYPQPEKNPYQLEWDHLVEAILQDKPYNEVERGTEASLVTAMGRMAAHTGRVITRDEIVNCEHEFAPTVDQLSYDTPAPLLANAEGKYAIPLPGLNSKREY
jgi:predicted dehydrogenase